MTARFRVAFRTVPVLLLLAACTHAPQTPESRANQATLAACRQRAEEVYLRQNRDQLYQTSNSETPYSAAPNTGLPTHGLSALYARDQFIDDCVRNTGTETQRNGAPAVTTPVAQPGEPQPPPAAATPVSSPAISNGPPANTPADQLALPPASLTKPTP